MNLCFCFSVPGSETSLVWSLVRGTRVRGRTVFSRNTERKNVFVVLKKKFNSIIDFVCLCEYSYQSVW